MLIHLEKKLDNNRIERSFYTSYKWVVSTLFEITKFIPKLLYIDIYMYTYVPWEDSWFSGTGKIHNKQLI